MAVVYKKSKDGTLEELGRTEVVLNSLNPKWFTKLIINYQFEVVQTLVYVSVLPSVFFSTQFIGFNIISLENHLHHRFRVYDVDTQFQNVDVKVCSSVVVSSWIYFTAEHVIILTAFLLLNFYFII